MTLAVLQGGCTLRGGNALMDIEQPTMEHGHHSAPDARALPPVIMQPARAAPAQAGCQSQLRIFMQYFSRQTMLRWYLPLCRVTVWLGWVPMLCSKPLIHGGTWLSETLGWAGLVLGAYAALELVRSGKLAWYKAPALAGCIFYGALVATGLYFQLWLSRNW